METSDGDMWLNGAIGITRIPADNVRRVLQEFSHEVEHERFDFRDGLEGAAQQIRPQPTVIAGTDGSCGSPPPSTSPGSTLARSRETPCLLPS